MESTISQAHSTCTVAFLAFIEALQSSSDHQHLDEAHDAFDRYRLWAGNMGAMHNGQKYRMSLDYRLREASFYKLQVFWLACCVQLITDPVF
jgi:hypothetical protein